MKRKKEILIAIVLVVLAVLLFDLGGIRSDMAEGFRDGLNATR